VLKIIEIHINVHTAHCLGLKINYKGYHQQENSYLKNKDKEQLKQNQYKVIDINKVLHLCSDHQEEVKFIYRVVLIMHKDQHMRILVPK